MHPLNNAALVAALTVGMACGALPEPPIFAPSPLSSDAEHTASLRLNFRGAPLESVLSYLSEAAGFVIVLETQPRGTVDVWSDRPLTREEALDLLNSSLLRNGCAAIRNGRILTIVSRDEAKTKALPVKLGANPESIPQTDELVTQILPVRFTEASQLIAVLQPLVSSRTTMTANESANTLVITDTQANIHRLAQVVQAVDSGAEDFTVVKVFHLRNANSTEMAEVLAGFFPDESRSDSGSASPVFGGMPGGFPGGPPGGFSGPGGGPFASQSGASSIPAGTGSQARRLKNRAKVVAVADSRTQALVVTASRDLMPQVESVVRQLDADPRGKQSLSVLSLQHASPAALAKVLQDTFQSSRPNNQTKSTQTDPLENRATMQNQQNNQTTGSSRTGGGMEQGGVGGNGSSSGSPGSR